MHRLQVQPAAPVRCAAHGGAASASVPEDIQEAEGCVHHGEGLVTKWMVRKLKCRFTCGWNIEGAKNNLRKRWPKKHRGKVIHLHCLVGSSLVPCFRKEIKQVKSWFNHKCTWYMIPRRG